AFSKAIWNRARSSAAALRVKVIAAKVEMLHLPSRSKAIMRSTMLRVLPVPADASTSIVVSSRRTMSSRAGWSGGKPGPFSFLLFDIGFQLPNRFQHLVLGIAQLLHTGSGDCCRIAANG